MPEAVHQASHTHHRESGDLLMAQMRDTGCLGHIADPLPDPLQDPQLTQSLPRTVIFTVAAAHISGAMFPQGHGEKSCTTPLLFFAVLVFVVVGGDWVSHSSPRSEMLGLPVCLSSQLLAKGRKGMKGRAEPKPRENFPPWFLGEDV